MFITAIFAITGLAYILSVTYLIKDKGLHRTFMIAGMSVLAFFSFFSIGRPGHVLDQKPNPNCYDCPDILITVGETYCICQTILTIIFVIIVTYNLFK